MTTIACDGRSMAGDGLVTSNGTIFGHNMRKVRRLDDGRIVGTAGSAHDGAAFVEWLTNGGDKPALADNFEALVLMPNGQCLCYDEKCVAIEEELPTATGSGREFAIAAMDLGKTPVEAVAYAATRNTGTGGKIIWLSIEQPVRAVA